MSARPAATVVLYREDGALLLMQRSLSSSFFPGAFVFPGGVVEATDAGPLHNARDIWAGHTDAPAPVADLSGPALYAAYARAAAREVSEEVGLTLDPNTLHPWSRWITPEAEPKRYDTLFFTAPLPAGQVTLGAAEAAQHVFLSPRESLARFSRGELMLPPPTCVTVAELAAAQPPYLRHTIPEVKPLLTTTDAGPALVLPGDPLHPAPAMTWPPPVTPRIVLTGWPRTFHFV